MSTTNDLQTILANLKSRTPSATAANGQPKQPSSSPSLNPNTLLQSHASTAFASGPVTGSSTINRSAMASPSDQGFSTGGNEKSKSLLNLLKFSQPTTEANSQNHQPGQLERSTSEGFSMRQESGHGKSLTASDLMASFLTPTQATSDSQAGGNAALAGNTAASSHAESHPLKADKIVQGDSQNSLLELLNRSVPSSHQHKAVKSPSSKEAAFIFGRMADTTNIQVSPEEAHTTNFAPEDSSVRRSSPVQMFGSGQSRENAPVEPPAKSESKERKPIFTYTNPFDALHASRKGSPRPFDKLPPAFAPDRGSNGDKRKLDESAPRQIFTRRKLTPKGPLRASSSAEPSIKGEPAPIAKDEQTVPDASEEAGKVSKHVNMKEDNTDTNAELDVVAKKLEETAIRTGVEANEELDGKENLPVPETEATDPLPGVVKDATRDVAAKIASYEKGVPRDIPVYNFPLKPFVAITIADIPPSQVGLRDDGMMEISRFKKDFDQLDRTLASATSKYIAYAFAKNGGIRVIRQDDGRDRQVFRNSGDRIFHVTLSTTSLTSVPTEEQGLLGVGLSGAVYYTTISKDGNDLFENDGLAAESLIFPPYPVLDDNSSGGTFKTRVRRSSRHPEFFAIGRGKTIHIVWPSTAMSTKYGVSGSNRTVDVEKLLRDRPLKIATGKAGKDFIFSEDDTAIASLDKAGSVRFWDVRTLVNESTATASKVQAEEISVPILSLATTSPAEKCWPTSVLFVDKIRPYIKATALRYILVGFKQNHTLQLWDIALGKAVQELNFPHVNDADGICSVAYHANTGMIVVGHPTRNSIFFLNLSAPRYTLQPMSQATYLERVASRDATLSKLEATAFISGMREISMTSKGQLRSLDLLPVHKPVDAPKEAVEDQPLFELYAVHSGGVTCLTIKKEDLGWGPDGKVLHAVDNVVEAGVINLTELRHPFPVEEANVNGTNGTPQPSKASKKKGPKGNAESVTEATTSNQKSHPFPSLPGTAAPQPNGVKGPEESSAHPGGTPSEKDKRKKKKSGTSNGLIGPADKAPHPSNPPSQPISPSKNTATKLDSSNQTLNQGATDAMASERPPELFRSTLISDTTKENTGTNISEDRFENEFRRLEASILREFVKQLDKLHRRVEEDRNVQDAANSSRQEAILRLLSSTLSSNIEATLSRIVGEQMQQFILPAVTNVTGEAVRAQVGEAVSSVLRTLMPQELGSQLSGAITVALQNPTLLHNLTGNITKGLTTSMELQFAELMHASISPAFQQIAAAAAEKATREIEHRVVAKVQQYDVDRQHDAGKIEMLQATMQQMMEMLNHLSDGQVAFQEKILKYLSEAGSQPSSSSSTTAPFGPVPSNPRHLLPAHQLYPAPPVIKKSAEELEMEEIGRMLTEGKFEEASIKWLQSSRAVQLFDEIFVNYTPDYLNHAVSPLVAFSVGVTVSSSFEHNVHKRLDWIYTALKTIDTKDPEMVAVSQHAPPLLMSIISKLEQLLVATMKREKSLSSRISWTINKAKEVHANFSR